MFIAYLQLYMKFIPEVQESSDEMYCSEIHFDFAKPITEEVMDKFLNSFKELYEKLFGKKMIASYITKEEYDKISSGDMNERHFAFNDSINNGAVREIKPDENNS